MSGSYCLVGDVDVTRSAEEYLHVVSAGRRSMSDVPLHLILKALVTALAVFIALADYIVRNAVPAGLREVAGEGVCEILAEPAADSFVNPPLTKVVCVIRRVVAESKVLLITVPRRTHNGNVPALVVCFV